MSDAPLAEYLAVRDRVDAFAQAAEAGQAQWLACQRGCDGCCRLRRTAFGVEVAALRAYVTTLPPSKQAALRARRAHPEVQAGRRCVFLDDAGACDAYAARPLICRTHGPLVITGDGPRWCGLNFDGIDDDAVPGLVPSAAVLDLDRVNTLLAVVAARFRAASGGPERAPLDAALDGLEALDA